MSKKPKLKLVPEESLRRTSKFPRGNTVFTRPVPAEKWEWTVSIGAKDSEPEDRDRIGMIVRVEKRYRAKSVFFKYPLDHFTSLGEAEEFLKEVYEEQRMLESEKWAPGGSTKDVRFGRGWNNRGVKGWNES